MESVWFQWDVGRTPSSGAPSGSGPQGRPCPVASVPTLAESPSTSNKTQPLIRDWLRFSTLASGGQLQRDLHPPRRAECVNLAEVRGRIIQAPEPAQVDPVQRVEALPAQLHRQLLGNFDVLDERRIQI